MVESGNLGHLRWRDPLRHVTADLIREKLRMHLIHVIVVEYGCPLFVAILSARHP